jgi:hypothetical protein
MSLDEFRREFEYLVAAEPPPLVIDPVKHTLVERPDGPGARAPQVAEPSTADT